jgi:hypothetical protein
MKPALPREGVVPWASEQLIPWIFSMIAISASERLSAEKVVFISCETYDRHWSKVKS